MSVVVAVTKRGRTCMAADTLYLTGPQKDYTENLVGRSKIRRFGSNLIGLAGWSVYQNIFAHYLAKQRGAPLKNEEVIFEFFLKFWKTLRARYPFVREQREGADSPFGDLDSSFLLANRHGIFDVHGNLTVWRHREFCAIGSGSQYAYGALHALSSRVSSARELAEQAVLTAIRYDDGCGGPIEIIDVPK